MDYNKFYAANPFKTPALREITRKSLNAIKNSIKTEAQSKHYILTQQRPHTASSSVPHKNNTSQHGIDKPLLSSRGYGKENDLNTSDNSFKIAHHDDDRFDTNPNTARGYHHNHPKTMITLPPNFGGNYTQYDHDGSRSPITANTTHNNIQLEDSFYRRVSDIRPLTSMPSANQRAYYMGNESAEYESAQNRSRNYPRVSERIVLDLTDIDKGDRSFKLSNENRSGNYGGRVIANIYSKMKTTGTSFSFRLPKTKPPVPTGNRTPVTYTNRLDISGFSKATEDNEHVNRTYHIEPRKQKAEAYDLILKKHLKNTPSSKSPVIKPIVEKNTHKKYGIAGPVPAAERDRYSLITRPPTKNVTLSFLTEFQALDTSQLNAKKTMNIKEYLRDTPQILTDRKATAPSITKKIAKVESLQKLIQGSNLLESAGSSSQANLNQYRIDKVLGQGSYAVVKLAIDKTDGKKVAIKTYEKYKLLDPRKMKNVRREISLLESMEHHHVIKMHGSVETPKQIHIIMEYVGKNSLHSYLRSKNGRRLDEPEAKRVYTQICQAISYCHSKNIAHRDLKLENILIDDDNNVKVIDFGFSICVKPDQTLNIFCGTPSYMAPEIVSKRNYKGFATDVWALGILLFALLCGHFPFRGYDDKELFTKIKKGRFDIPAHVSEGARHLIQRILKVNPEERPTVDQILADRWLSS